jgi:hypothetical protein
MQSFRFQTKSNIHLGWNNMQSKNKNESSRKIKMKFWWYLQENGLELRSVDWDSVSGCWEDEVKTEGGREREREREKWDLDGVFSYCILCDMMGNSLLTSQ